MKNSQNTRSSTSYKVTVKMIDGKVAPEDKAVLEAIKLDVKKWNSSVDSADKLRVQLKGRGPRAVYSAADFGGRRRCYDQGLPLKYATHADVYVYDMPSKTNWW